MRGDEAGPAGVPSAGAPGPAVVCGEVGGGGSLLGGAAHQPGLASRQGAGCGGGARGGGAAGSVLPPDVAAAVEQSGWPAEVFQDPSKQPRVVHTCDEFFEELLLGCHLNDVVVFPGGLKALGLDNAIPEVIATAARNSRTVREFLRAVPESELAALKARLYHVKPGEEGKEWRCGTEAQLKETRDGTTLESLADKARELLDHRPDIADSQMYLAELRRLEKYRHPDSNEWVKTAVLRDVKHAAPPTHRALMPYWDVWDEGVFVGGALSGSPLHVDQVSWSNVGKNYQGCKLLAVWPYGRESFDFLDEHLRMMFCNRRNEEQMGLLRRTCKVAMVRPGDVFLFSGANPHTAMCVGDALSVTAYESFVNLNPTHARVFVGTRGPDHFDECWADLTDVEDIVDDCIDTCEDALDFVEDNDGGSASGGGGSGGGGGGGGGGGVVPQRLVDALHGCIGVLAADPQIGRWHSRRRKRPRKSPGDDR